MTDSEAAHVWREMRALMLEKHDTRRAVAEATGMSFLRAKLLTKLLAADRTVTELADILASDAPYVSLNIRELEKRELVIRTEDPDDRRRRIIGLTDAGRRLAEKARAIADAPPPDFTTVSAHDLAQLRRILQLP
ncbi:Transcriptional regulator, MarR family [Rhodococcus sp. AW25M09]|uniref:MarR family winged helix-turn-helix transcriptional regulator n=1 Tax=Rhodococcus sp. AW25M09 TaxID=1268303 RepID=UPI0002AD15AF|nr:MarR family transcriptional regulator [Rhodococcus sp. AW25M09]CCQ13443.1 Transcriptional regulator, MarR family [Rhodococcus sp. AW25M09]